MPAFFFAQNPGKVLNRQNFIGVFQKAWVQGMMISNVIGCFRATGVYPIDRRVPLSHLSEETSVSTRSASLPMCLSALPERRVILMTGQHALSYHSPPPLQLMR